MLNELDHNGHIGGQRVRIPTAVLATQFFFRSSGRANMLINLALTVALSSLGLVAPVHARPSTEEEMETRAEESALDKRENVFAAEKRFHDNYRVIKHCKPKRHRPTPFLLYFEVLPNGKIGETLLAPPTSVGKCMLKHARRRGYPKSRKPYVVKIDMTIQC